MVTILATFTLVLYAGSHRHRRVTAPLRQHRMPEVGRQFLPVRQNSTGREKLEEMLVTVALWPRLAKGCLPNTMALLAFLEKLGKFRPEAAE
jgi:hypothetical protein